MTIELRPDEEAYLAKPVEGVLRCAACGHLMALHNFHCCEFCMVDGCSCEWETNAPERNPLRKGRLELGKPCPLCREIVESIEDHRCPPAFQGGPKGTG